MKLTHPGTSTFRERDRPVVREPSRLCLNWKEVHQQIVQKYPWRSPHRSRKAARTAEEVGGGSTRAETADTLYVYD